MSDDLLTFIAQRRAELERQLQPMREAMTPLLNEMAQLDRAESAISGKFQRRVTAGEPGTIIDAICRILSDHPGGMMARDILVAIPSVYGRPVKRTSLSPQLTRAAAVGRIRRDRNTWHIVSGDEDRSPPLSGETGERS